MNHFERRGGAADGAGESFEVKVIALLFLRGHKRCQSFRIASNMEYCGAFDDVIFQYLLHDVWHTSFLQLKHKKSQTLPLKSFCMSGNDFDLLKYLQSYHTILQRFSPSSNHPVFGADLDHCSFFLYTNAVFTTKRQLPHGQKLCEDIHNSGGENGFVFGFSEENKEDKLVISLFEDLQRCQKSVKDICERNGDSKVLDDSLLLEIGEIMKSAKRSEIKMMLEKMKKQPTKQNLENLALNLNFISVFHSFLKNVKVLDGQSGAENLDAVIKKEIHEMCGTSEHETNDIFNELIQHVEEWWRRDTEYLTERTKFWKDIMQSRADRIVQLSEQKLQQLNSFNVIFRDTSIISLTHPVLNIVADRGCTILSCVKVRQALEAAGQTKYLFINVDALEHKEKDVLSLWPTRWCDTLVVDCGESAIENLKVLQRLTEKQKLILVSTIGLPDIYPLVHDICGFEEMHKITQNYILEKSVIFQSYNCQLRLLTGNNNALKRTITADIISQLLMDIHIPTFGKPLTKLDFDYVKRKLQKFNESDDPGVTPRSVWSLSERLFLLSADPGVGKTTFLTHMAIQSKEEDRSFWIIAITLNENSANLDKLSDTECSVEQAVEFLWEAAGKHSGSDFERALFWHAAQTSGKLVVLLDGFDEIYPTYTTKTLQLIKYLMDSKAAKLCLAFRPLVKDLLESELNASSFTLMPLTDNDQLQLLKSRWINCCVKSHVDKLMLRLSETKLMIIKSMNKREFNKGDFDFHILEYSHLLLDIISSKLSVSFCSIPLHVYLLATVFESYVTISIMDGIMYVPETINILNLYSDFVDIKLKLYYDAKKEDSKKRAAIEDDNELLREYFTDNYKIAGVLALLPDNLLKELHDTKLANKVSKFLKRIEDGKEKRGVVVQVIAGKPYFVHRTFAEYFAAMWFSENFSSNRTILRTIYFSESYTVFREMFDRMLSEKCHLHQLILNGNDEDLLPNVTMDINETDNGGRTALHFSALYQKIVYPAPKLSHKCSFVEILLHHAASIRVEDSVLGLTPLQYADRICNWPALSEMFEVRDIEPSHEELATKCQLKCCELCVVRRMHADVSMSLLVAVDSGNVDLALFLVSVGVDVDSRDEEGNTPLLVAVRNSYFGLVRALVEIGANVTVRNAVGETAIDIAENVAKCSSIKCEAFHHRFTLYYSGRYCVVLPIRNYHLLEFCYSRNIAYSLYPGWTYYSMFVKSFMRNSAISILKYLNGLPINF
ncbi:uncharacterized protein [Periplaneta americana]|uniref:uncharacterized protein isoform X1 n=1 Tax=Periplaneta americana TaxID=6978 RepID=UPI0037E76393